MEIPACPHRRRSLAVICAVAVATATWVSSPVVAQSKNGDRKRLSASEKQQIQGLSTLVDAVQAQQRSAPADMTLTWRTHFLKAEGNTVYAPYTIGIDGSFASPPVAVYVRIVKQGALLVGYDQSATMMRAWRNVGHTITGEETLPTRVDQEDMRNQKMPGDEFAFEDAYFFKPPADGRLSRAFWLPPGDYDVYVALREKPGKNLPKTAVLKRQLSVPDLSKGLTASSIIVADQVEAANERFVNEKQLEYPYSIAGVKITPVASVVLSKDRELAVVFWIYNEGLGVDNKPDLEVQYNFFQQIEGAENFFNKTTPQTFNAQTMPPDFNPAAGHQIIVSQAVPLSSFPAGDYRLEIKVLDKTTSRYLTRDVHFSVVGS